MKKTRIRLLSDLHLELHDLKSNDLDFKKEADIVILAGDIGNSYNDSYTDLIHILSLTHEKVIIITGNHEYYSSKSLIDIDNNINKICEDEDDIHFLQKDSFIHNRIKFVGCTLWSQPNDITLCKYMNDFKNISDMTFQKYVTEHQMHKEWLRYEIAMEKKNYDKVCVITHHLPSYLLVDKEYLDDPLNSFFASNTFDEIEHDNVDVWCYGHTHMASQKNMKGVDFYCNPRGYVAENSGWTNDCVFEL